MSSYFYEADWPFASPLYAVVGEYDERMPKEQLKVRCSKHLACTFQRGIELHGLSTRRSIVEKLFLSPSLPPFLSHLLSFFTLCRHPCTRIDLLLRHSQEWQQETTKVMNWDRNTTTPTKPCPLTTPKFPRKGF